MVMVRVVVVCFVFCVSTIGGTNGFRVTGGNVQFSPDQKSLTIQLQLDGPTGVPTTSGGSPTPTSGGTPNAKGGGAGGGLQPNIGEFTQVQRDGLKAHNDFRRKHGAPPMTLDKTMCQQAAAYAAEIAQAGQLRHSQKNQRLGQGENLSMGCSSNAAQTVTEAVTNWYNEVCDPGYTFGLSGSQGGTGHFTQVVWKASTLLGIGKADIQRNGMKCSYTVGRYKPLGNFNTGNNDYQKNVLKGSFQESYCQTINSSFRDQLGNSTVSSIL